MLVYVYALQRCEPGEDAFCGTTPNTEGIQYTTLIRQVSWWYIVWIRSCVERFMGFKMLTGVGRMIAVRERTFVFFGFGVRLFVSCKMIAFHIGFPTFVAFKWTLCISWDWLGYTSPVWVLRCSSRRHDRLYDFPQFSYGHWKVYPLIFRRLDEGIISSSG